MAIAALGLALSAIGTFVQLSGQAKMTAALKSAEAARQQQLALDTMRRNRETIRQGQVARSQAEATAVAQNAQGGSGLSGAEGQIGGEVGRTLVANNQNQQLGNKIFEANQAYYSASGTVGLGAGLSSLGGLFMNNAGIFNRIGGGMFV